MVTLLSSYLLSLTGARIQPRFLQWSHPVTCTDPLLRAHSVRGGGTCSDAGSVSVQVEDLELETLEPRQGVLNPGWGNPRVTCIWFWNSFRNFLSTSLVLVSAELLHLSSWRTSILSGVSSSVNAVPCDSLLRILCSEYQTVGTEETCRVVI